MLKSKKGFSLIELLAVILTIGILTSIAIPGYKTSVAKTKIVANMMLLRAMQNGIVHFYDLNGFLPTKISQLPINPGEFRGNGDTSRVHIATNCTFSLVRNNVNIAVTETCADGDWTLTYPVQFNQASGYYVAAIPTFTVNSDEDRMHKIANNFGWELHNGSTDVYEVR